jgi:signal transduction histidine kinase
MTTTAPVTRIVALDAGREERLRIARELHDVIGYGLASISIQATSAVHVLATRPEQAGAALRSIQAVSAEALCELRSILGLMREAWDERPAPAPPGIARVHDLAAAITEAGVDTRVQIRGHRRLLPAEVDLAAFRIIQESLVNVLRHAGPTSASVLVSYERERVVVEIRNERGLEPAPSGESERGRAGHGILGMRERAADVGGTLEVAPRPAGGFCVRAMLPSGLRS